jgi:putative sigma-54 modulation protein
MKFRGPGAIRLSGNGAVSIKEIDMHINITGHHIEVTPALKAYVTDKLQRIHRHFDHVISTDVILRVENHHKQAEAKVVAAGKSLFAQESGDDMYAAIDGLIDKIDKQVRRYKDRVRDHQAAAVKKAVSLG